MTTLQTFRQILKPYLFECYEKHLTIFNLRYINELIIVIIIELYFFVVRITKTKTHLASTIMP